MIFDWNADDADITDLHGFIYGFKGCHQMIAQCISVSPLWFSV